MKLVTICATCLVLLPVAHLPPEPFDGTWKVSLQHIPIVEKAHCPAAERWRLHLQDLPCTHHHQDRWHRSEGQGQSEHRHHAVTVIDANTVTAVYKLGGKTVQNTQW